MMPTMNNTKSFLIQTFNDFYVAFKCLTMPDYTEQMLIADRLVGRWVGQHDYMGESG